MVKVEVDEATGIALVNPTGSLSAADFEVMRDIVDAYLEEKGDLRGLLIHTPEFPGWDSFRALLSHLYFIKDFHARIRRVAVVTDSKLAGLADNLGDHFVAAQVEAFPYKDMERAKRWILD